ncbi:MAG: hybrid sensor histidine kinase/response regulator, partial [Alistipes sp.]|nr:hybrid sensor histidine kinase/response regulator [Alistipes sp.]
NFRLPGIDIHIFDIAETDDCGRLVLATDIGVALFDKAAERLEIKTYMTEAKVQTLCAAGEETVIGTSNGMYRYSSAYGTVTRIMPELEHCDIACVAPASSGGVWIGTFGNGLYLVDSAMNVAGHISAADGCGLNSDYVRVVKEDSASRTLWIGTFDGLAIYDLRTGKFVDEQEIRGATDITRNSVRSIFTDSQNGVWIGTYYGGVNYFHPLAGKFTVIRHEASRNSLSSNTASCIVESPDGSGFWIGTNDGGVNFYDRRTGRFACYDERHGLASNNVKCIMPDGDCLWIGTHAGGLHCFDLRSHRAHSYAVTSGIPINNSCYSMLDNGDGTITVGSLSGLYCFDKRTGRRSDHPVTGIERRLSVEQILAMH